jgi:LysM repeat protein
MKAAGKFLLVAMLLVIPACASVPAATQPGIVQSMDATPEFQPTPLPTRSPHPPGQIVPYEAQNGDTLAAIAAHFNTTVPEILEANPGITEPITTLPPGYPMQIPAYYVSLTGSPFKMLPDSEVVYAPTASDFNTRSEVLRRPGFITGLTAWAFERQRTGWELIQVVAENYSLNPRLLLALLEHQTQALTKPFGEDEELDYPLGFEDERYRGIYLQLLWAAERLNDGYYGWRTGSLREFELADGLLVRPDPWLNAGTVAVQHLFAGLYGMADFNHLVGPEGFIRTYERLWGNPFTLGEDFIPANLQQPDMTLPFIPNHVWNYSGGPHFSWGSALPMGALDFAPPTTMHGCQPSGEWVAAPAAGVIARSGEAAVLLDLDGDGDEHTGWVLFFFHLANNSLIAEGTVVEVGDMLGRPSCDGGRATGTHVHIARRYNGEWITAGEPIPFVLDGWVADYGDDIYLGTLTKGSQVVIACDCASEESKVIYRRP